MSTPQDFSLPQARIAILGLGLMGGSLALALRGKCARLLGFDPNPETCALAESQQIVDEICSSPQALARQADLLVLAAPLKAILAALRELPGWTPNPCLVMDLGSTKRQVLQAMSKLPQRFDPLGAHPLCGKEKLSLRHAERTLYYGAAFLLTPLPRSTPRVLNAAGQIIAALGARPLQIDAETHDSTLALTSHLPFLLSSALALATPAAAAPLIGPGFRSASRLAGTPASMMLDVLTSNRENVLTALSRFQQALSELQTALQNADDESLTALLNQCRQEYKTLLGE